MAVSTIASALGGVYGIKDQNGVDNTTPVINAINGHRTAEQMIGEYFGLRKEVIRSDDGTEVIDMINEFRDPVALKFKKVQFVPYFASKGMTEEMFYKVVPREHVYVPEEAESPNDTLPPEPQGEPEPEVVPNAQSDEQPNDTLPPEPQGESALPTPRKRAGNPKK